MHQRCTETNISKDTIWHSIKKKKNPTPRNKANRRCARFVQGMAQNTTGNTDEDLKK